MVHTPENGRSDQSTGEVTLDQVMTQIARIESRTRRTWLDHASRAGLSVAGLLVPAATVGFMAWLTALSADVDDARTRLRVIEDTRFTTADAERLRSGLLEAVAVRFPPPWMADTLRRIESATSRTDERLQQLEQRMAAVEATLKK